MNEAIQLLRQLVKELANINLALRDLIDLKKKENGD